MCEFEGSLRAGGCCYAARVAFVSMQLIGLKSDSLPLEEEEM